MRKTFIVLFVLVLLVEEVLSLNIGEIGCTRVFFQGFHMQLPSLMHQCLSSFLGAERSFETVSVLVTRNRPIQIVKTNLLLPLLLLLFRFPFLKQWIL